MKLFITVFLLSALAITVAAIIIVAVSIRMYRMSRMSGKIDFDDIITIKKRNNNEQIK